MSPDALWAYPVRLRLRRPFRTVRGTLVRRSTVLVAVHRGGAWGFGECAPPPFSRSSRNPLRAIQRTPDLGGARVPPWIRAGLMAARLDAEARRSGQRLSEFLRRRSGSRTTPAEVVRTNAVLGQARVAEVVRAAERAVEAGYGTLKLKSQASPEADLAQLRALRDALGDTIPIRLDANGAWSLRNAEARLGRIARYEVEYVEQPLAPSGWSDLHALSRRTPVPIALDESVTGLPAARRILGNRLADVLVLKVPRVGGLDRALAILRAAERAGVDVVLSSPFESAIGRLGALHVAALARRPARACGLGTGDWFAADVAAWPRRRRGGRLRLPAGIGLGIRPKAYQSLRAMTGGD